MAEVLLPRASIMNEHYRQISYFAIVGGISAGIYFLALAVLLEYFSFGNRIAVSVAFVISTCFNFFANRNFTFKQRHSCVVNHTKKYLIMLLVSYAFTMLIVEFGVSVFNQSAYISSVAAIVLSAFLRFTLSKLWVFS